MTQADFSERMPVRAGAWIAVAVAGLGMLVAAPLWAWRADLRLMMEVFSFLALAQMWNLLAGYTGLISVGQQAFVGLGGYLFFALAMYLDLHPLVAMPLAAVTTLLIAVPTGWIAFRLQGAYFAIGTWVIAEVFRLGFAQIPALGGGSGISLPTAIARSLAQGRMMREYVMYWIALGLAVTAVLGVWLLLRSQWGLALTAIRDSTEAAESLGVPTRRVRFLVYVGTAGFTALVGAFIFLQKLRISPEAAFSVNDWTAFVIFIVVIGGIGTLEGPIIGVIVFFALRETFADLGTWYLIGLGLTAIGVMMVDRRGIWGALRARGMPQVFRTQRRCPD
ncbi:branched-chain amino acid ABC transporter permease [Sulfitobacter sp. S190]|uniref:branched-chain amino acid ABC transporter permease n=1 Tax=Sulfitobacter sp. S190 TaxID=2867022 RepID=UPI0021A5E3C6|nr:branched-chain amino acid ABC transporter permease [Sulfitobacter sp. S190]UWR23175.1 branched-chain amino acid ABC transporter permease [Sulfitobacter sp. S190]